MTNKVLCFVYRERYLAWGTVVVSIMTALTGFFIPSVVGYTCGVAALKLGEWIIR